MLVLSPDSPVGIAFIAFHVIKFSINQLSNSVKTLLDLFSQMSIEEEKHFISNDCHWLNQLTRFTHEVNMLFFMLLFYFLQLCFCVSYLIPYFAFFILLCS